MYDWSSPCVFKIFQSNVNFSIVSILFLGRTTHRPLGIVSLAKFNFFIFINKLTMLILLDTSSSPNFCEYPTEYTHTHALAHATPPSKYPIRRSKIPNIIAHSVNDEEEKNNSTNRTGHSQSTQPTPSKLDTKLTQMPKSRPKITTPIRYHHQAHSEYLFLLAVW